MQEGLQYLTHCVFTAGVRHVVLCPGSRNAPLIAAFNNYGKFIGIPVLDERSAGFVAIGIARITGQPVAVVTTSGSAVTNLYPAITEAAYLPTPIIIISADRPQELLDAWDGQTIKQENIFGEYAERFVQVTADDDMEALAGKMASLFGIPLQFPVHLNVQLREPLYKDINEKFPMTEILPSGVKEECEPSIQLQQQFLEDISAYPNVLWLNGAYLHSEEEKEALEDIHGTCDFFFISDIASGVHYLNSHWAWEWALLWYKDKIRNALGDYLLVTTGTSHLSKNLKAFIRSHKPKAHYHISADGLVKDQFFTSPVLLQSSLSFISDLLDEYYDATQVNDPLVSYGISSRSLLFNNEHSFFNTGGWNEFVYARFLFEHLREGDVLHLANSMPVRYASLLLESKRGLEIYTNRGVSGIDGCISTAVGAALAAPEKRHFLFCGDLSFAYDHSVLWNNFNLPNLKIVILNNGGGGIFRMIDGPSHMEEVDKYVVQTHSKDFSMLAKHYNAGYISVRSQQEMLTALEQFNDSGFTICEIFTDSALTAEYFKKLKQLQP